MFKNAILYRIAALPLGLGVAVDALAAHPFAECSPSQELSTGWVPARGEANGPMVESIGGQWIAKFQSETKTIPGAALKRKVDARLKAIEETTGRKPGRKETKELKEDVKMEMLPMAFSKIATTWVWIDPVNRLLLIDASGQARADDVATALVKAFPQGFALSLINTQTDPQTAMSRWLCDPDAVPASFTVDRECELRSTDESKATVRYSSHPLDINEVREHIEAGKRPTKLALTWDDRVSFVLTHGMQLKGIELLGGVGDGVGDTRDDFDADVTIATGELVKLIPALLDALDGEAGFTQPEGRAAVVGIDMADEDSDRTVVVTLKGGKVSASHNFGRREGAGLAGAG